MRLRWWVFLSTVFSLLSFITLYYIVTHLWPVPQTFWARPHLLFFVVMFIGLSTATIPVTAYMNHRFAQPGWRNRDSARLLREGVWVGLLGVLFAYLQLLRALNWPVALVLICVFIFIETFLLTRE